MSYDCPPSASTLLSLPTSHLQISLPLPISSSLLPSPSSKSPPLISFYPFPSPPPLPSLIPMPHFLSPPLLPLLLSSPLPSRPLPSPSPLHFSLLRSSPPLPAHVLTFRVRYEPHLRVVSGVVLSVYQIAQHSRVIKPTCVG
jgi:hypothetical protein